MIEHNTAMLDALQAGQPNEALASKLQLYGQFVGSWQLDIDSYQQDGSVRNSEGEWHFAWVLEGRAIQDVWIFPARRLWERANAGEPSHQYGSTFRWYEPAIDAWHITWFEPTRPLELHQIGRLAGDEIVQIGEVQSGLLSRWRFVEITEQSFRWLGERSRDEGSTWTLIMEMRARKVA